MSENISVREANSTLKQKLAGMLSFFDKNQRCFYVDYPLHTNVGDLLINAGNEAFFRDHNVNIVDRFNYYDFQKRIGKVGPADVFLFHGGGNLGDLWFNFQTFREMIMSRYPRNRVVFLPQTVHFSSPEAGAASVANMNKHGNYHIFARDLRSLKQLSNLGVRSVSPMPDPAHALYGKLCFEDQERVAGPLFLFRRDRESAHPEVSAGNGQPGSLDWDHGTFSTTRQILHKGLVNFIKGIGRYGPSVDCTSLWYWHRDKLIQDGVNLFSRYDHVVTDRLHGMILGLLLERKVTVFDNHYGKLSSYYQTWLSGTEGVRFETDHPAYNWHKS